MGILSLDNKIIPIRAGERRDWGNLSGSSISLAISNLLESRSVLCLLVTQDSVSAEQIRKELAFFKPNVPLYRFPDWETLIYDSFSPHQDIISERLHILNRLPYIDSGVVIVPANTLAQKLAPPQFILNESLLVSVGEKFDFAEMRKKLISVAYRSVDNVLEHGEFAVRGSIMDIFPMGSNKPYRIDLFDNEVDSIRIFDAETQLSISNVNRIELLPAREIPLTEKAIKQFQDKWYEKLSDNRDATIYSDISAGISPPGIEYYLPLFFDELATLFDYVPEDTLIITTDIENTLRDSWTQAWDRYENLRHDILRPIPPPNELLLATEKIFGKFTDFPRVEITTDSTSKHNFDFSPLPNVSIQQRSLDPLERLKDYVERSTGRLLITAESIGRKEIMSELFQRHQLTLEMTENWESFLNNDQKLCLCTADVERGFSSQNPNIALITEQQLFGERVLQQRRREYKNNISADLIIKSLTELHIGAPVVHIDHGVGRYLGLKTLTIDEEETEFLCLEYEEHAKLYVPVSSLHLISRYAGSEEGNAPLHRLGGDTWNKAKRRAAEQIYDVAAELLSIYARRAAKKGFSFATPDQTYDQFVSSFPFEETPDQESAIRSVVTDMSKTKPMDRLICGDVGFGKTEVAMRAAFIAVQSGKQVAVLVPTTLLAQQHQQTFLDRFAEWPFSIEAISRFRTKKEQHDIRDKVKSGQIDIIIGTHTLIQDDIVFKDLGLLIIDEEHRFGVRQKEKLKSLRAEVDILALTATPIPRTLNMAISNMRDLSIVATPPSRRLSVKTFVQEYNEGLIKEAIQRELLRGGQVYYLHNEVRNIDQIATKLLNLVPEARIAIGHGQMRERQLEGVMSDFYNKKANVLVCTTIIENGIDIPNANTIIIERADKFGLAQIHQLRGRVGRSHHQAYAYLMTPNPKVMSRDAQKRLEAITEADHLGAGFILATHDLEIRGAGELLGDGQSGNIQTIGYSMYMEMLNHAVKAIQDGKTPNLDRPLHEGAEINLRISAIIPESYLPDTHARLVLYKRIANAKTEAELRELQVEMIDRFSLLPDATRNLFRITLIKINASTLGIKKIDAGIDKGKIEFLQDTVISPDAIVSLVQSKPQSYKLTNANQLTFYEAMEMPETRFTVIENLLTQFGEKQNWTR